MNERPTDFNLLQRFARQGDQEAFATVVRRHVDLVYATALRKIGDGGGAEEVAQNVYVALARKAWQFAPGDSLPAWLYRATLLEAKEWLRGELRRRRREQTAVELGTAMNSSHEQSSFRALIPMLDEALLSLRSADRAALLLRYYEHQTLRELGASLGISEDAAQKRVATALDRVARFFQRHGYRTGTVAAAAAALEHTAAAAPSWVSATVLRAAVLTARPALLKILAARLIALTRIQKAAVVLLLLAIPFLWRLSATRAPQRVSPTKLTNVSIPAAPAPESPAPIVSRVEEQPAPQAVLAPPARVAIPLQKEYTVRLRGVIGLPGFKAALLRIEHRAPGRSGAPTVVIHRILTNGEVFEDHSVSDAYVHFELLEINAVSGTIRLGENDEPVTYALTDETGGTLAKDRIRAVCLPNIEFSDFVDIYGELIGRTVLCPPAVDRRIRFSIFESASTRLEVALILERAARGKGLRTVLEGERFALVVPRHFDVSNIEMLSPPKTSPVAETETMPVGSIWMENVTVAEIAELYGALSGRTLVRGNSTATGGSGVLFCNQTPLTKPEALYALDVLLTWEGYAVTLVGESQFKVVRAPRKR